QSATSLPHRHRPLSYPPLYVASSTDKHYILGLLSSKNPTSDKSLPKAEPQGHPPVFAHLWFLFVAFRQEVRLSPITASPNQPLNIFLIKDHQLQQKDKDLAIAKLSAQEAKAGFGEVIEVSATGNS
ncbi:hypothetical protein H0H93_009578, partial [Arthromyces matolae]